MKILGVNKGLSLTGKELHDGSLTLLENGRVTFNRMEERVSKNLRAGGFMSSLVQMEKCLKVTDIDIDVVAISTCTETEECAKYGHELSGHKNLITVNHHISHAWGTYVMSGFDNALVVVLDGGGNILSVNNRNWWEEQREQHSYFLVSADKIELIDRDFSEPFEIGFGELYRAMTYYCGWKNSRSAANVMALASYGNYWKISNERFINLDSSDRLNIPTKYEPGAPEAIITNLSRNIGIDFGVPNFQKNKLALSSDYWHLCSYLQWNVEQSFLKKLQFLKKQTGAKKLCLAGGFALNCVFNARISESNLFEDVYVSSVPGDHGQSIGNAFYANFLLSRHTPSPSIKSSDSYLGFAMNSPVNTLELSTLLSKYGLSSAIVDEPLNIYSNASEIVQESPLAVFFGHSEYGLRALGNRSIIMRSDNHYTTNLIKDVKAREWFRPFAPVILEKDKNQFYESKDGSPFMSFALTVNSRRIDSLKATVSGEGRARFQTADEQSFIGKLLLAYRDKFQSPPVLLNTSFNKKGFPIVENIEDAIEAFSEMPLNHMLIDKYLITKKINNFYVNNFLELSNMIDVSIRNDLEVLTCPYHNVYQIFSWLYENTGLPIFIRNEFSLFFDYLNWLRDGSKTSTIRRRNGGIEFPSKQIMPLWESSDEKRGPNLEVSPIEELKIKSIEYIKFGNLNEADATRDGFASLEQMRTAFITRIYPGIKADDWVSLYHIEIFSE